MKAATLVNKGAKLLDKKMPGWARKIKLDSFNINSNTSCILGQLSKGEPYVLLESFGVLDDDASKYGFVQEEEAEEDLEPVWIEAVKSRRKKISPDKKIALKK